MSILYRGFDRYMHDGEHENIFLESPRLPKKDGTPLLIHKFSDSWFYQKFEVRARSETIICSTDIEQSTKFASEKGGTLGEIIPTEPFGLIYSASVKDFMMLTHETADFPITQEVINNWLDFQNYQFVKSCDEIHPNFKGEVLVVCERYRLKGITY
jgi:hypothetical protein